MLNIIKASRELKKLPKFYIGQEVLTECGVGLIVEISMPFNGLYLSPDLTIITVWYGTGSESGYVSKKFNINDLNIFNNE